MMSRRTSRVLFLGLIPVLCLAVAGYAYLSSGRYVTTKNAYVKSRLVNISADVDGRVVEVLAANNRHVLADELLFRLDPEPAEIGLAAARAEQTHVRQRLESLKLQYQEALLSADNARERIRFLGSRLARQQRLLDQGVGMAAEHEQAEHELEMGRRALAAATQHSAVLLAELGGSPYFATRSHALYLAAESKVREAERRLESTRILAPTNGILSKVTLEVGEYVETGDVLFSVVESGEVWVEANLKESQLTHLRAGQLATVVLDAYPAVEFQAHVASLSPATGAEFAVLPPQNATGNWVKVVQRIPVRLDLVRSAGDPPLRAGMTSTVTIDTRRERELPPFLRAAVAQVSPAIRQVFAKITPAE